MPAKTLSDPHPENLARLRVFVDADVLFAGAAAPQEHSASLVLLRMAELTLIDALTSEQVIVEAERNLEHKLPAALPAFHMLVSRCIQRVPAPDADKLVAYRGLADEKDLPILVAAIMSECPFLATFNVRHYQPGSPQVRVLRPGDFVLRARERLAQLPDLEIP